MLDKLRILGYRYTENTLIYNNFFGNLSVLLFAIFNYYFI